jgi:hypothetical protein
VSFAGAIAKLNLLKRRRIIRDYAIVGSIAASAYMEPMFTEDLDIVLLVDSDLEYIEVFGRLRLLAESMEGMHLVFAGTKIQMFPATIKPLYTHALRHARQTRIGGLRVKVARPEHLILMYLESYRPKDKTRIQILLPQSNGVYLARLFRLFDDENKTLAKRFASLR